MVDFIFKRKIFRIREMAFASVNCNAAIGRKKCDVVYLHSSDEEMLSADRHAFAEMQHTLVNDLNDSMEQIASDIKKNCKYEIRRAEKEGAKATVYTDNKTGIVDSFERTYNAMFVAKGMSMVFNRSLVEAGLSAGQLVITCCEIDDHPNDVVYHAYLADGTSTLLMYSVSPLWNDDRENANCIGRMNKYLHYKDMEYFKNAGYTTYEWGGIGSPDCSGGADRFKAEFGGKVKCFCNYFIPQTLLGRVYVYLVRRSA